MSLLTHINRRVFSSKFIILIILCIFAFIPTNGFAAVAQFSASPTNGIPPLTVNFTDESTYTVAIESWEWDFDNDGSVDSTAQNPEHTYSQPGVYTVSLTVTEDGAPDTTSVVITVYEPVTAGFSAAPESGIAPVTVAFTNMSTGDIESYSWDFGDGTAPSIDAEPSHSYNTPGTYTVTLTVNGLGGDTDIATAVITVYEPVTADFSATPESGIAPLTVGFTNLTTGDIESYSWDFGEGTATSTDFDPSHTYDTPGSYTVTLTVNGLGGDSDTATALITVYEAVVADFTATPSSGVAPLAVQFNNLSTGDIASYTWDFGDGTAHSTEIEPSHTYDDPGTYTVSLTVVGQGGDAPAPQTEIITVYSPAVANFTATPASGVAPLTVQFNNLSSGDVASYLWDFGDGTTSSDETPPVHTYDTPGPYTVSLTVVGQGGDEPAPQTEIITVYAPAVANFSATPASGVAPLSVQFNNLSTGDIASYLWDFGDGTTSSDETPPLHTYDAPGPYTVSLTVVGQGGDEPAPKTELITVYAPAVANFSATPTLGVAPLAVQFNNLSTGDFDSHFWDFGDGTAGSTEAEPSHTYDTPGPYTVSLTVSGLGGSDSITQTDIITVYAPAVANFSATPASGVAPLTVQFNNLSSGDIASYEWDFGDGTPVSSESEPLHTYATPGSNTVSLTVSGLGGSDTITQTDVITVYTPAVADFSAAPLSGARPLTVTFTDKSTGDITSRTWDFGDGTTSESGGGIVDHEYSNPGQYTVKLTVIGPGGEDVKTVANYIEVSVSIPDADFSADITIGPEPLTVNFTDQSVGNVLGWQWDFDGDGTVDSTEQHPTFEYDKPGWYTVSLTAVGLDGDTVDTRENYIYVQDVITLQWDANREESQEGGLTGYKIYYKEDAYGLALEEYVGSSEAVEGPSPIIVGLEHPDLRTIEINDKKVHQFNITGLPTEQNYFFFAITAFNIKEDQEHESDLSNITGTLSITPPDEEESYRRCEFYGDNFVNAVRESSYALCGLGMPGEQIELYDGITPTPLAIVPIAEDGSWSTTIDFTAAAQGDIDLTAWSKESASYPVAIIHDSIQPQFADLPQEIDGGDTHAIVQWETSEPSSSKITYYLSGPDGENLDPENTREIEVPQYKTIHYFLIDDLLPEQHYRYTVVASDIAGNTSVAAVGDYTTPIGVGTTIGGFLEIFESGEDGVAMDYGYIYLTFNKPNMQGADNPNNYTILTPFNAWKPDSVYKVESSLADFTGESYEIYFSNEALDRYEVYTIALTNITDFALNDGLSENPLILNDADGDGMADEWELDYGFDPTDSSDGDSSADADDDGYSNRKEYIARTDPHSAGEYPFEVISVLPPHETGLVNDFAVPNDTGVAILIGSLNGIDTLIHPTFVRIYITVDGTPHEYDAESETINIRALPDDYAPPLKYYWISYDRAADTLIPEDERAYPYDAVVDVRIEISDINAAPMNPEVFQFKIESLVAYSERTDPAFIPDIAYLENTDPIFTGHFDTGFEVTSGDMSGVKILYNSLEDTAPQVGAAHVIPPLSITNIRGWGQPLNLQPHTVFNEPVKIVLPLPVRLNPDDFFIFLFNGKEWVQACDLFGNIYESAEGWVVPNSILVDDIDAPTEVEFQVYHFSAVQAGTVVVESGGNRRAGGIYFGSGGGGGCFVEAVYNGQWSVVSGQSSNSSLLFMLGVLGIVGLAFVFFSIRRRYLYIVKKLNGFDYKLI